MPLKESDPLTMLTFAMFYCAAMIVLIVGAIVWSCAR
jgi:hypothetical protein